MARGWRGNVLGLSKFEVELCNQARLDAIEAVAQHMREGKHFRQAKALVMEEARQIYKWHRPELYEGCLRCVDIDISDVPDDVFRIFGDEFLADVEKMRGYPVGPFERWIFRLTGTVFSVTPKKGRRPS